MKLHINAINAKKISKVDNGFGIWHHGLSLGVHELDHGVCYGGVYFGVGIEVFHNLNEGPQKHGYDAIVDPLLEKAPQVGVLEEFREFVEGVQKKGHERVAPLHPEFAQFRVVQCEVMRVW